ncbi:MAG: LysR family transcriptional regulator [Prochloraceae cyanobacterium]
MELRHLRYFVAVAEELHFGRAAKKLHICQQPLSQQIRNLEKELNVRLFDRTKRSVRLTSAGAVFLEEAKKTLKQAQQAVESAQKANLGQTGSLSIGFTTVALTSVIPKILPKFRRSYPEVSLTLHELENENLVEALLSDRIDVAFLHPPVNKKNIFLKTIYSQNYSIVLPEKHPLASPSPEPISLKALAEEPFISFDRNSKAPFYHLPIATCQQAGFSPKIVQEADTLQTQIALVAMGMGITFLPESLKFLSRSGVVYRKAIEPTPEIQIAIATRYVDPQTVLNSFVKLVKQVYPF